MFDRTVESDRGFAVPVKLARFGANSSAQRECRWGPLHATNIVHAESATLKNIVCNMSLVGHYIGDMYDIFVKIIMLSINYYTIMIIISL